MEDAILNSVPYKQLVNPKKEAYEISSEEFDIDFEGQVKSSESFPEKNKAKPSSAANPVEFDVLNDDETLNRFRAILESTKDPISHSVSLFKYLTIGEELLVVLHFSRRQSRSFKSSLRKISTFLGRSEEFMLKRITDCTYFRRFTQKNIEILFEEIQIHQSHTLLSAINWHPYPDSDSFVLQIMDNFYEEIEEIEEESEKKNPTQQKSSVDKNNSNNNNNYYSEHSLKENGKRHETTTKQRISSNLLYLEDFSEEKLIKNSRRQMPRIRYNDNFEKRSYFDSDSEGEVQQEEQVEDDVNEYQKRDSLEGNQQLYPQSFNRPLQELQQQQQQHQPLLFEEQQSQQEMEIDKEENQQNNHNNNQNDINNQVEDIDDEDEEQPNQLHALLSEPVKLAVNENWMRPMTPQLQQQMRFLSAMAASQDFRAMLDRIAAQQQQLFSELL